MIKVIANKTFFQEEYLEVFDEEVLRGLAEQLSCSIECLAFLKPNNEDDEHYTLGEYFKGYPMKNWTVGPALEGDLLGFCKVRSEGLVFMAYQNASPILMIMNANQAYMVE